MLLRDLHGIASTETIDSLLLYSLGVTASFSVFSLHYQPFFEFFQRTREPCDLLVRVEGGWDLLVDSLEVARRAIRGYSWFASENDLYMRC